MTFRSIYEGVVVAYSIDRNVELTPNMALANGIDPVKQAAWKLHRFGVAPPIGRAVDKLRAESVPDSRLKFSRKLMTSLAAEMAPKPCRP